MATLDEIDAGVTALGLVQANNPINPSFGTYYGIGRLTRLTTVTTCNIGANAVTLPINPIIGAEYIVVLSQAATVTGSLVVFPAPGTTNGNTATINGGVANGYIGIGIGGSGRFFCTAINATTGNTWTAIISGSPPVKNVTTTATGVLTANDSGSVIAVVSAAAAVTIALPAVGTSAGVVYHVRFQSIPANIVTISALTAVLMAKPVAQNVTAVVFATAHTNALFSATTAIGDGCDITCDGVNWYMLAVVGVNTTLTAT